MVAWGELGTEAGCLWSGFPTDDVPSADCLEDDPDSDADKVLTSISPPLPPPPPSLPLPLPGLAFLMGPVVTFFELLLRNR